MATTRTMTATEKSTKRRAAAARARTQSDAGSILTTTATALGGDLCGDDECLEARMFSRDEIPWEQLAFQSTNDALRDYLSGGIQPF